MFHISVSNSLWFALLYRLVNIVLLIDSYRLKDYSFNFFLLLTFSVNQYRSSFELLINQLS